MSRGETKPRRKRRKRAPKRRKAVPVTTAAARAAVEAHAGDASRDIELPAYLTRPGTTATQVLAFWLRMDLMENPPRVDLDQAMRAFEPQLVAAIETATPTEAMKLGKVLADLRRLAIEKHRIDCELIGRTLECETERAAVEAQVGADSRDESSTELAGFGDAYETPGPDNPP